jgi:hypothetical protein
MRGPMAKSDLRLDWATHEAAKFACEKWHYAKRIPVGKLVKIGVWENESFRGVVIFSCGCGAVGRIYKSFHLMETAVCELQRVALRDHVAPVTQIVSIALRMLKKHSPLLELCISYADPAQGHEGTIYKAGNWFSWGKSSPDRKYKFADGAVKHSRNVSENGKKSFTSLTTRKPSDAIEIINLPSKYRFLYPLGGIGRSIIEDLRAKQAMAESHSEQRRSSTDPRAPPLLIS